MPTQGAVQRTILCYAKLPVLADAARVVSCLSSRRSTLRVYNPPPPRNPSLVDRDCRNVMEQSLDVFMCTIAPCLTLFACVGHGHHRIAKLLL